MSIFGIGKDLVVPGTLSVVLAIVLQAYYPKAFCFYIVPRPLSITLGAALCLLGIIFLITALKTLYENFKKEVLITGGIYAWCRNPIYAGWILLILPGIAFLLNSWLILAASFLLYIVFKFRIQKEEQIL